MIGCVWYSYAGQSRSATVVLAYLMQLLDLSLEDATNLVRKQRPQIRFAVCPYFVDLEIEFTCDMALTGRYVIDCPFN